MKWEDLDAEQVRRMAEQIQSIHQDTNIDGYGDEGAGYDYELQVKLLLEAGWTPPEAVK